MRLRGVSQRQAHVRYYEEGFGPTEADRPAFVHADPVFDPELVRYCTFPSLPLDYPGPGPSKRLYTLDKTAETAAKSRKTALVEAEETVRVAYKRGERVAGLEDDVSNAGAEGADKQHGEGAGQSQQENFNAMDRDPQEGPPDPAMVFARKKKSRAIVAKLPRMQPDAAGSAAKASDGLPGKAVSASQTRTPGAYVKSQQRV
jgi:hypothetical protein